MTSNQRLTAALLPQPEGGYTAQCLEADVVSEGETVEEAIANLREALALYFEGEPAPALAGPAIVVPIELAPR